MKLTILRIDFYLQLVCISLAFIGFVLQDKIGFYGMYGVGLLQTISIIYHSIIAKTKSTNSRSFHYAVTAGILILLFLLYFSVDFDLDIVEVTLPLLFIISILSIIMVLVYFMVTYDEIIKRKEENERTV